MVAPPETPAFAIRAVVRASIDATDERRDPFWKTMTRGEDSAHHCRDACIGLARTIEDAFPDVRRQVVEELIAEEDAAREARKRWRPIESAPRDGTVLLLFGRAEHASASVVNIGWWLEGRWIDSVFAPNTPTTLICSHWMPRPPFPGASPVPERTDGE